MEDLEMVQNPGHWSNYPILPLVRKNSSGDAECGLLIPDNKPVVHIGNMFILRTGIIEELVKDWPIVSYESFEELVMEWRVD